MKKPIRIRLRNIHCNTLPVSKKRARLRDLSHNTLVVLTAGSDKVFVVTEDVLWVGGRRFVRLGHVCNANGYPVEVNEDDGYKNIYLADTAEPHSIIGRLVTAHGGVMIIKEN